MGPIAIGFGLASAAVLVIAALFSTRANVVVAAFLAFMWAATKVWNYKTGTDAQLYLDTALAMLCGLLCVEIMRRNRRVLWPLLMLGLMATWVMINAAYADLRDTIPQVKWPYQFASNLLYGAALFVGVTPGVGRGCLAVLRFLSPRASVRTRLSVGDGWGRHAPDAIWKRKAKAR